MDLDQIISQAAGEDDAIYHDVAPPPMVPGRVLQIDADICAYECCNLDEPFAKNKEVLKDHLQILRIMAGAENANLHLTMGNKGGRYEIAQVQEYQAVRANRDPLQQERVRLLREAMAGFHTEPHLTPVVWKDQEADDGMCIYQTERVGNHGLESSVICTVDKDLDMVPGLHMHLKTYEFKEVPNGYGEIWLDNSTSTTKVKGVGKAFFFAQLLMGDSADSIPGLPRISAAHNNRFNPTTGMLNAKTPQARAKIAAKRKGSLVGPVLTQKLLGDITSEQDAFKRVHELYVGHYGSGEFDYETWRGDTIRTTAGKMMLEQAELLWMRRTETDHVKDYFNEILQH